jgi:hypothetical protein
VGSAELNAKLAEQAGTPLVWRQESPAGTSYWEWLGNQTAAYLPAYSVTAATRQDSTAGDPGVHQFMILAHDWSTPGRIWESLPVTGYSVDNLAPPAPMNLVAFRFDPDVQLTWSAAAAPDTRNYAVYRDSQPGVATTPANLVGWSDDTFISDANPPVTDLFYRVAAFDVHGNQGPPSNEVAVSGVSGVEEAAGPTRLTVLFRGPNPSHRGTALRIGLPTRSDVTAELFDLRGRRVHRQVVRDVAPGWRTLDFSGRNDRGELLASGVYLCRVAAGGKSVVQKVVVAK